MLGKLPDIHSSAKEMLSLAHDFRRFSSWLATHCSTYDSCWLSSLSSFPPLVWLLSAYQQPVTFCSSQVRDDTGDYLVSPYTTICIYHDSFLLSMFGKDLLSNSTRHFQFLILHNGQISLQSKNIVCLIYLVFISPEAIHLQKGNVLCEHHSLDNRKFWGLVMSLGMLWWNSGKAKTQTQAEKRKTGFLRAVSFILVFLQTSRLTLIVGIQVVFKGKENKWLLKIPCHNKRRLSSLTEEFCLQVQYGVQNSNIS